DSACTLWRTESAERGGQFLPGGLRDVGEVGAEHLDRDVRRAGLEVCVDSPDGAIDATCCHDGVDEAFARAIGDIGVGEAEALQVVHVVRCPQVDRHAAPGDLER